MSKKKKIKIDSIYFEKIGIILDYNTGPGKVYDRPSKITQTDSNRALVKGQPGQTDQSFDQDQ